MVAIGANVTGDASFAHVHACAIVTDAQRLLAAARTVLVVDWPSRDVPESLARAGFDVFVKGGPGPDSYSVWEVRGDEVVSRSGTPPVRADIVYAHRPLTELPGITALALELGAAAIWTQSGHGPDGARDPHGCWVPEHESSRARALVEAAGLAYVDDTYIVAVIGPRD